jgi:hypothetical protein
VKKSFPIYTASGVRSNHPGGMVKFHNILNDILSNCKINEENIDIIINELKNNNIYIKQNDLQGILTEITDVSVFEKL